MWLSTGNAVQPIALKTGASDATYTEIVDGSLVKGATMVTRIAASADARQSTRPGASADRQPADADGANGAGPLILNPESFVGGSGSEMKSPLILEGVGARIFTTGTICGDGTALY